MYTNPKRSYFRRLGFNSRLRFTLICLSRFVVYFLVDPHTANINIAICGRECSERGTLWIAVCTSCKGCTFQGFSFTWACAQFCLVRWKFKTYVQRGIVALKFGMMIQASWNMTRLHLHKCQSFAVVCCRASQSSLEEWLRTAVKMGEIELFRSIGTYVQVHDVISHNILFCEHCSNSHTIFRCFLRDRL